MSNLYNLNKVINNALLLFLILISIVLLNFYYNCCLQMLTKGKWKKDFKNG